MACSLIYTFRQKNLAILDNPYCFNLNEGYPGMKMIYKLANHINYGIDSLRDFIITEDLFKEAVIAALVFTLFLILL